MCYHWTAEATSHRIFSRLHKDFEERYFTLFSDALSCWQVQVNYDYYEHWLSIYLWYDVQLHVLILC